MELRPKLLGSVMSVMVRLFLPDYLHKDSHKFIIEYEKFKKRN
jgi:hypothetical protein